jgi:MoxR-like ATPase
MSDNPPPSPAPSDAQQAMWRVREEVNKVVVGQDGVLSGLIAGLLVRGHVLLEGVPGVAKTLLVKSLSASLDLSFKRVQFTPDLMPSDITGQLVLQHNELVFREGPLFANLVLADEINRTPAKTQAALLEAMEERQVTTAGETRPLPDPFCVVATQNPVEYEGTYPLPEAQLDRFLFKLTVGYPTAEQEVAILASHEAGLDPHDIAKAGVQRVAGPGVLAQARSEVAKVTVDPKVQSYIVALARATRDSPSVTLGVSPRGATMLLHATKAWAWLTGKTFVTPDDVKVMAKPTWRHRLQLRSELELEGATADGVIDGLLATVPVPR